MKMKEREADKHETKFGLNINVNAKVFSLHFKMSVQHSHGKAGLTMRKFYVFGWALLLYGGIGIDMESNYWVSHHSILHSPK